MKVELLFYTCIYLFIALNPQKSLQLVSGGTDLWKSSKLMLGPLLPRNTGCIANIAAILVVTNGTKVSKTGLTQSIGC